MIILPGYSFALTNITNSSVPYVQKCRDRNVPWPKRSDRKVVYPAMDPRIFGQRNEPLCNKHIASIETKFQSTQLYSADKTKM